MKGLDCRINEWKWRCTLSICNDEILVKLGARLWQNRLYGSWCTGFLVTGRNFGFESSVSKSKAKGRRNSICGGKMFDCQNPYGANSPEEKNIL